MISCLRKTREQQWNLKMQEDAIKQEQEKQMTRGREKTGDTKWNQEQGGKLYVYLCVWRHKRTHICVYVCKPVWMLRYCPCMFTSKHRHTCMYACLHLLVYNKQHSENLMPLLDVVRLSGPHPGSLTPVLPEGQQGKPFLKRTLGTTSSVGE